MVHAHRVLPSIAGHVGLFGFEPSFLAEVDSAIGDLLATSVGPSAD